MKTVLKVTFLLALFILSSCSKHRPAPVKDIKYNSAQPLSKQNQYRKKSTTVKKGDTLYSIGFKHNIDFKTLAQINNISSPYRIYPGQKLKLIANKRSKTKSQVTTKPLKQKSKFVEKQTTVVNKTKPKTKPLSQSNTVSKTTHKPTTKTINKPSNKPIKKPIQQAPSSNSKWIWPVQGRILSSFSNTDATRKGLDIKANIGDPVYASNNGVVVYSGNGLLGYGELIIIKHSDALLSAYANNSKRIVQEGQTVKQGDTIAHSGKATDGTPLLHFEIRKNGKPVNPNIYLPKR